MTAFRRACAVVLLILAITSLAPPKTEPPAAAEKPLIQVALLLDTSNSMDGLINQARTQLWTIVNEFARTKQDGQTPVLQVALYEYGNSGLPASGGDIRPGLPPPPDLPQGFQKIFSLSPNGGEK